MKTYRLVSTKGSRTYTGTMSGAIRVAIAMEEELQPAFGISVENAEGETVAEVRDGMVDATE